MLDLRRLRYFVTVADELHFGRAAERLHIAQPPLTRQISALETELGIRLFERSTRAVTLTPEGAQFLDHARQVLDAALSAQTSAQRLASGEAGRLAIGYTSSIPMSRVFSEIVRDFGRRAPEVALSFREVGSADHHRQIAAGVLDIAFGWAAAEPAPPEIAQHVVASEPLVAAVPSGSAYAACESIDFAALAHEAFITYPPGHGWALNAALNRLCAQAGITPRPGPTATQVATLVALVAAERGVAIVPASVAALQMPGVRYVPLAGEAPLEQTLLWRAHNASNCALRFVELARESVHKSVHKSALAAPSS
ncbi:LysR family transcriptional regulator [Paraburkholderia sp. Ac-20340]|uniref:LysR substrate-binding domain-containing protein n=1 Tax=Paraburkholderia sp. Ac-20340 TaxID=2703888 RepID=UPI00197CC3EE|nr:LysR substrate-binding domain-containing protein [Paraburkholderia sp. Ac-20340]MBN3858426.1 LysR family transcriptional regulator [Paraburkholderia sp. Ac-20340]